MTFFAELKRRNVVRMAGLYLVSAWLIVQIVGALSPMFDAPAWVGRTIVMLLAVGFIPALIFSWVYEITPEGLKRESEIELDRSITPRTGARMDRAIVALLVLAVGIFAVDRFVLAPRRALTHEPAAAEQAPAAVVAAPASEKSIAVLPLANASDDKDQQYFSDGLSDGLIIALTRLEGLKVIGRNSTFQFRDSGQDSRAVGEKLGVATLLVGSVQRAGDVVRISASLIRTADGSALWAEQYDRPYKDLFALQDEIISAVAGALRAKLLANSSAPVQTDRPPSGSLEAYNAYLQGKFLAARGNEADIRAAIEQYSLATRSDPRYALAWADLSRTWAGLATQHLSGAEAQDAYVKGREAVATALRLDANLAAAYWARGYLLNVSDFDWAGAEKDVRRGAELAPGEARGKFEIARASATLGRPHESIPLIEAALIGDPLNARWRSWLATFQIAMGDFEGARGNLHKANELQPRATTQHQFLSLIDVLEGNEAAALAAAAREPPGVWADFATTLARQLGSDRAAADAALKLMIDRHASFAAYQIADVYALRQDPDRMFEWLDRAWDSRDPGVGGVLVDPLVLAYQDDPRFAAFCRKVRLPTTTTAKAWRVPEPKAGKS